MRGRWTTWVHCATPPPEDPPPEPPVEPPLAPPALPLSASGPEPELVRPEAPIPVVPLVEPLRDPVVPLVVPVVDPVPDAGLADVPAPELPELLIPPVLWQPAAKIAAKVRLSNVAGRTLVVYMKIPR